MTSDFRRLCEDVKSFKNILPGKENQRKNLQIPSRNKKFPAFSDSVTIKMEAGKGRFGVAKRNINLGEVLCIEEPPVFVLHQEHQKKRCYFCFSSSLTLLSSPFSSNIWFCSKKCFENVLNVHQRESSYIDSLTRIFVRKKVKYELLGNCKTDVFLSRSGS